MLKKRLAPPPGKDEALDKRLDSRIEQQRQEARINAEKKRAQRLAQKKESAVETLAQAISEISSMAQETASTINELESTVAELSASATQTSKATDESSVLISKNKAGAETAKRSTLVSLEKVESLQRHITTTTDGIISLISGIDEVVKSNRETVSQLKTLESQSAVIESGVGGILQISEQINLFAINAAIQASRAGEHGTGFSVVADEVRKLAEQTGAIAGQITQAVSTVGNSVKLVVSDLDALLGQTEKGAAKANEITGSLNNATSDVEIVRKRSDEISGLLDAFTMQMTQMEQNGEVVASGAAQYAAAIKQASASLQEQVKGLETIGKTAADLDVQVNHMLEDAYTETAAEELATSAEEMSAIVEESSASVQQISSAINEITQTASEQSAMAKESGELAEQAVGAASEISTISQTSLESIQALQSLLKQVESESTVVIEGVTTTATALAMSSKKISNLAVDISGLERVVGKLTTINLLTHLLSVSGRIESAKAGEHGAGFASVSEDIRQLVEQSADKIASTSDSIRSIQETLKLIAGDVELTGNSVRQEAENAKKTASRLVQTEANILDVVQVVKGIQQMAEESHKALEKVKESIDSISQAAEQASTACEEAASAVAQQSQAMAELATTSEEIAAQADTL